MIHSMITIDLGLESCILIIRNKLKALGWAVWSSRWVRTSHKIIFEEFHHRFTSWMWNMYHANPCRTDFVQYKYVITLICTIHLIRGFVSLQTLLLSKHCSSLATFWNLLGQYFQEISNVFNLIINNIACWFANVTYLTENVAQASFKMLLHLKATFEKRTLQTSPNCSSDWHQKYLT